MLNNISQITQVLKAQLIPLATLGLLTLALAIAMVVEKFSAGVEEIAIQQVRAPAKTSFNWFGAKAVAQKEVDTVANSGAGSLRTETMVQRAR